MADEDKRMYNDPIGGTESDIGPQIRTDYFQKKALIEAAKETYFGALADVTAMPKNMGKKITRFHYLPILDDRNINDQGLDASGVEVANEVVIEVRGQGSNGTAGEGYLRSFVGNGADAAAALTAAELGVVTWAESAIAAGGLALTTQAGSTNEKYVEVSTTADASAYDLGYRFVVNAAVPGSGNLYGSSKDIGYMTGKMPVLGENGGRVNRVGMKRITISASLEKRGFFDEYTQESLDFDSDAELEQHITREMVMAANELTEDQLQIDLLNGAGVVRFTGDALQDSDLSPEAGGGVADTLVYDDFVKLAIELNNNRTPTSMKLIKGSLMTDTKVVKSARPMYIGAELQPSIMRMKDYHDEKAFIPVAQYADAGNIMNGEVGAVDGFRIIVVPEMAHYAGAGAAVGTNPGYHESGGSYDIYPMLVVGKESFTTVGFQTDGKSVKFKIAHKKPEANIRPEDPYGEIGFMSIKWYYATMILRSERLAVMKTVAEY